MKRKLVAKILTFIAAVYVTKKRKQLKMKQLYSVFVEGEACPRVTYKTIAAAKGYINKHGYRREPTA